MERSVFVSSLAFKFFERFAVKGTGLVIGIILARLLLPEDFGQVAIITVFVNLGNIVIQSGFNSALVQKKDIEERDYSTAFYICSLISVLFILILCVLSPLIAMFYDLPELIWPIRVYSFSLLFGAFNSIQIAKIQREMRFKQMMVSSLIATLLSGLLGIITAYMNFGIWALVFYGCSNTLFSCIAMLPVARWLPKMVFSIDSAKSMFSFGGKLLVSAVLCSVYNDVRSLIIGKRYSTESLGFYNKGQQYPNVFSNSIDNAIQSVMFPTMSRVQNDKEQLRSLLKKSVAIGVLIIAPVMIGLAAVAENFVSVLLTDKWLNCVIYMQIICFAELTYSFSSSSLIVIKSMGRSDVFLKLEIVRRVIMLVILVSALMMFDSVLAIAISYIVSCWLDVVVISVPLKKLIGYGFVDQIKDNFKTILAALIMGVIVYVMGFIPLNAMILLCLQIAIGMGLYIALCALLKIEIFGLMHKMLMLKLCKSKK